MKYYGISFDNSWDTSPRDILIEFNVPNVVQRRDYFNGINANRCLNGTFPNYMSDMLYNTSDFNTYATRNASNKNLYIPMPKVELYRQSFQYTGPKYYNSLPQDVKDSQSLNRLKANLKDHIMSFMLMFTCHRLTD